MGTSVKSAFILAILLIVSVLLISLWDAEIVSAHNRWNGGYRKWPWKADTVRSITTLPNTPPHSSESNQLAMDFGMSYTP